MKDQKIYIIGAGLSGLVAAIELEKAGFSPIILESTDKVGGRMKTDQVDGYLLDHGFQVILTAYPEVKRYLNLPALNLKTFDPGAVIFDEKDSYIISDPLRNPLKVVGMAFSRVGTFLDKVKMFTLTQELKKKSVEDIFNEPSKLKLWENLNLIISNFEFLNNGFYERWLQRRYRGWWGRQRRQTALHRCCHRAAARPPTTTSA